MHRGVGAGIAAVTAAEPRQLMKILRWWTGGLPPVMATMEAAKGRRKPRGEDATPGVAPLIPAAAGIATATADTGGGSHLSTRLPAPVGRRPVMMKLLLWLAECSSRFFQ